MKGRKHGGCESVHRGRVVTSLFDTATRPKFLPLGRDRVPRSILPTHSIPFC